MQSQGVLTAQLGSEDLDQMVQAAIQDDVVQALLKTGHPVTQESYLALAHPEDDPTMPEVVAGLPAFFSTICHQQRRPRQPYRTSCPRST